MPLGKSCSYKGGLDLLASQGEILYTCYNKYPQKVGNSTIAQFAQGYGGPKNTIKKIFNIIFVFKTTNHNQTGQINSVDKFKITIFTIFTKL